MSNWLTAVGTIRARCNKTSGDDDRIKRALCDTIQMHRHETFAWNQERFSITLTDGYGTYAAVADLGNGIAGGLPADLVAIVGTRLTLLDRGNADDKHPLEWVPRETMEALRDGTTSDGEPYAWSFWNERLELYSASDSSLHKVQGSYIQDVGTPSYTFDGATWTFLKPDGSAMADAYTSPWFNVKQGFQTLCWHAEYLLWTSVWQATAGQGEKALQRYLEARASQASVTAAQAPPRRNQPYIPPH